MLPPPILQHLRPQALSLRTRLIQPPSPPGWLTPSAISWQPTLYGPLPLERHVRRPPRSSRWERRAVSEFWPLRHPLPMSAPPLLREISEYGRLLQSLASLRGHSREQNTPVMQLPRPRKVI